MTKPPVPQINEETGISMDYNNQLQLVFNYCDTQRKLELGQVPDEHIPALATLMGFETMKPLPTYEQRYAAEYANVLTPKNKYRVAALDMLVHKINSMIKLEERDYRKYFACIDAMHYVINGYRLSDKKEEPE